MKRSSKTLTSNWEKIPQDKKTNLLTQMYTGAEFCMQLNKEDEILEVIPERLAKQDAGNL